MRERETRERETRERETRERDTREKENSRERTTSSGSREFQRYKKESESVEEKHAFKEKNSPSQRV